MSYLDDTGLAYFWGKIKAYVASLLASKADDTDVVHKTGNETIAGTKTFSIGAIVHERGSFLSVENYHIDKGVAPSSTNYHTLAFYDKNGNSESNRFGFFENFIEQGTGKVCTKLGAYKNVANSTDYAELCLWHWIDGTKYATCPTPPSSSNSNAIATTKWVNEKGYITSSSNITGTAANVTGTVAIENGGTGQTTRLAAIKALTDEDVGTNLTHVLCLKSDWSKVGYTTLAELISAANLCTTDTAQTISASKTHTGGVAWQSSSMDRTNTSTSVDQWRAAGNFVDKNGLSLAVYSFHMAGTRTVSWRLYDKSGDQHWLVFYEINHDGTSPALQVGGDLHTQDNGAKYLGLSSRRWKAVYAVNGTIQTSDERIKEDVADLPEAVLDAWDSVEWKQFRMKDSVAKKGSSARLHSGIIAQRARDAFSSAGIDASEYGFFCWDQWDEVPARLDENGNVAVPAMPAGDQYSIRYDEALAIEAAYQRRENARLRARLAALEDRLAALELRLGSE